MNSNYGCIHEDILYGRLDISYVSYYKDKDRKRNHSKLLINSVEQIKENIEWVDGVEYDYYDTSKESISNDGKLLQPNQVTKQNHPSRAKQKLSENALIIPTLKEQRTNPIIIDDDTENVVISSGFLMIKPKGNLDLNYLKIILSSKKVSDYLNCVAVTGLGMQNWRFSDFKNIEVNIPTLEKQKRTIPLVQSKIKVIENKIKKLESERKKNSYMHKIDKELGKVLGVKLPDINDYSNSLYSHKIFDSMNSKLSIHANMGSLSYLYDTNFPIFKISKLLDTGIITKIQDGSHQYSPVDIDLDENGINYIQVLDMTPLGLKPIEKKITESFYNKLRQGYIEKNDVLLSVIGSVGISCIYDKLEKGAINVNIMHIRTDTSLINIKYLSYWLNSIFFNYQIMIDKTNMTRDQITLQKLLRSRIVLPNLDMQNKIVETLDLIESDDDEYLIKINKLQSIIDNDLSEYILNGYTDDLFTMPKEDEK